MNNEIKETAGGEAEQVFRKHLRMSLERQGFSGNDLDTKVEDLMKKGRTMPFDWTGVLQTE